MARVIQNELKRPLADAILFGELANGGTARVSLAPTATSSPWYTAAAPLPGRCW